MNPIPSDIRERIAIDFGDDRADEILEDLLKRVPDGLANGTRTRHLRCIVYLARGDVERLDRFIEMCLSDTRDVMLNAEYENVPGTGLVRKRDFSRPFSDANLD